MPFARWENFEACKREQMGTGHDEESAKKICGAIQARAEKGMLLKAEKNEFDILAKADGELVVGGYSSWELRDPQNDVITTQAQVRFLQKFFHEPEQYRNVMTKHSNFQIAEPLLKYTKPDGETVYSHVNEVGTYLIAKVRNNGWRSVQTVRKEILEGKLGMYSISGDPVESETKMEKGELVRYIYDIDPWEVTLCERGVNPKAHVSVLSKAEKICKPCVDKWTSYYLNKGKSPEEAKGMAEKLVVRHYEQENKCDTSKCGAECCRFVTQYSKGESDDTLKYLEAHGIAVKKALQGGYWLRFPVVCKQFDEETLSCKDWVNRPSVCKAYPRRESPFISKSMCNLMRGLPVPLAKSKPEEKTIVPDNEFEEILEKNWRKYVK